jgi:hypothetical protein
MKMRKVFLILGIALLMIPGCVLAQTFTFGPQQLSKFAEVYEDPGGGYTYLVAEGFPSSPSGPFTGPVNGGYQFYGQVWNRPESTENWGEIGIGSVLIKSASWQRDTLQEIGAADLTGYDRYELVLRNLSNPARNWSVNLFIETGYSDQGEPNELYNSGWRILPSGDSAILTLDLTSVDYLNHVTSIGFAVESDFTPGEIDVFLIQAYPVPYGIDVHENVDKRDLDEDGDIDGYDLKLFSEKFGAVIWYRDADEDGYSDGTTQYSVTQPVNYYPLSELTAGSGDCDDENQNINSEMDEICGDDTDNNCNDEVDEGCSVCGNGIVEGDELCDGSECCSSDCTYAPSTDVCRIALSTCDFTEYCSGTSGECPADSVELRGIPCDDGAGADGNLCNSSCDGFGQCATENADVGSSCGPGQICDGHGVCIEQ